MSKYMLLLRDNGEQWATFTQEQEQQMMMNYFTWTEELRKSGRMSSGEALQPGGATVRKQEGRLTVDGPYTETKEGIAGYYIIEVDSLAQAAEIAGGCPVLMHGGAVEVREVSVFN